MGRERAPLRRSINRHASLSANGHVANCGRPTQMLRRQTGRMRAIMTRDEAEDSASANGADDRQKRWYLSTGAGIHYCAAAGHRLHATTRRWRGAAHRRCGVACAGAE